MSEFVQRVTRSDYFLAALSGALLGVGFYLPFLWPLALVGLVPFFYIHTTMPAAWRRRALRGILLGLPLYGFALAGIFWHAYPVDWFGIASPVWQVVAIGGSWLLAVSILSLGTAAFAVALPYVWRRWWGVLLVPLAWVVGEWLGAVASSVLLAGPGSLIGANFTLGYLGYLLAHEPALLQLASLGGVYLLSAFVVFGNVLVFRAGTATGVQTRLVTLGVLLALVSGVVAGHVLLSAQPARAAGTETVRIAALSTYHPPRLYLSAEEEQARAQTIATLMRQAGSADAVLLPESSAFARYASVDTFPEVALLVDTENVREQSGDSYARALFRYADGRVAASEKQFVLPLGEYVPYVYRLVLTLVPNDEFREQVRATRSFVSGSETQHAAVGGGVLAVRFCDEAMSPHLYARDVAGRAQVLGNVSSYSWFHGSPVVFSQMQQIAKVRAVESGRWYVQSGNMAPAYVLDHHGRIVTQSAWHEPAVVSADVPLYTHSTIYSALRVFQ